MTCQLVGYVLVLRAASAHKRVATSQQTKIHIVVKALIIGTDVVAQLLRLTGGLLQIISW